MFIIQHLSAFVDNFRQNNNPDLAECPQRHFAFSGLDIYLIFGKLAAATDCPTLLAFSS